MRIGLGGAGPLPMRAARVEQALEGQSLDRASIEKAATAADLDPPSDFLGSREYRREMAAVLLERAVRRLFETRTPREL